MHLSQSMLAATVGIDHSLPRQLYVFNPVGDALAFHSFAKPTVPGYWDKRFRYSKTISIPRFGGGTAPFHFFTIPGVSIGLP